MATPVHPYSRAENATPINGIGHYVDSNDPTLARAFQGTARGMTVEDRGIATAMTSLSEIAVTERTSLIELNSSYGPSELRDSWTETDGATVGLGSTAEIEIETNLTGTAQAVLDSIKIGRYIPGYPAEIGVGFRLDAANVYQAGHDVVWGGSDFSGNNLLVFGRDDLGVYVNRRNLGSNNKVYQNGEDGGEGWNIDPLDGTGPSGFTLDTTVGNIYRVEYTWYGYGEIRFGVIGIDNTGNQVFIPCHVMSGFDETSIATPNLRIHVQANNGGATSSIKGYVGGRQYSVVGKYIPKYRYVDDYATATLGTDPTPLVSFIRKAGFEDRGIELDGFDVTTDGGPVLVEIFAKTTLSDGTPGVPTSYTDSEIGVQSVTDATAYTDGILIYRKMFNASQGQDVTLGDVDLNYELQSNTTVTITARSLSGSPSATVLFRLRELW